MQSNIASIPDQNPPLIQRLYATLREVDENLAANPDDGTAREFRRFLVRAIQDVEGSLLESAA